MGDSHIFIFMLFSVCCYKPASAPSAPPPLVGNVLQDVVQTVPASLCYNDQFANTCNTMYGGFVDGRNCFFLVKNLTSDVSSAWDICNSKGGSLASIFTQSEYDKIVAYLIRNTGGWQWVWLSMRHTDPALSGNAITPTTTFWYQNMTSYNPALSAGNTWIRYHAADTQIACGNPTYPCACVAYNVNFQIGSGWCQGNPQSGIPLCQITIAAQNYTKTNTCIEETPIETLTCTTVVTCAKACESRYWCRSFNLVGLNASCGATCQMFTWSVYDTCPSCAAQTVGKQDCVNYNYAL